MRHYAALSNFLSGKQQYGSHPDFRGGLRLRHHRSISRCKPADMGTALLISTSYCRAFVVAAAHSSNGRHLIYVVRRKDQCGDEVAGLWPLLDTTYW
jgi:hypothetical protein